MEEVGYTVSEIAKEASEKYKVYETEGTRTALMKKIRRTIEKQEYRPMSEPKLSAGSKKPAQAYSIRIKNVIIDELLFEYMIDLTQNEAIKKMKSPQYYKAQAMKINGHIEDESLTFINMSPEQQDAIMENQEDIARINEDDVLIREKKKDIMLEALFSKFYLLDIDNLVEDANRVKFATEYKQGEFDGEDMRAIDRFNNWDSYVDEKSPEKNKE